MKILLGLAWFIGGTIVGFILLIGLVRQPDPIVEPQRYSYDTLTNEIQLLRDEKALLAYQVEKYSNLYSVLTRHKIVIDSK